MKPSTFTVTLNADGKLEAHTARPAATHGIYFILTDQQIIRVGESSTSFRRILKGFREPLRKMIRGKTRKNYLAYSWRTHYAAKTLSVDYFDLDSRDFEDNHFRRALEAEITFQVRLHFHQWPIRMNEIHFMESFRDSPILVANASRILSNYQIPYQKEV